LGTELYIFSGLGADERVFGFLEFPGYKVNFIKWITPQEHETMEHYASRLRDQVTTINPVLIGLSFGGMMAVEVARQMETQKVILIASAKTRAELPFYYRVAGKLRLHKLIPAGFLKRANAITNWVFGVQSSSDKELLKQILTDTDPVFLKWAMDKIVHWKNKEQVQNVIHIHGSEDKILPLRYVDCNIVIPGGGHLMTLNKAKEVSEVLRLQLSL
jgi:pimeloyl-ACP methyl ester carboxylesterase